MKIIGEFAAALGVDAALQRVGAGLHAAMALGYARKHRERLFGTGAHGKAAPGRYPPLVRVWLKEAAWKAGVPRGLRAPAAT